MLLLAKSCGSCAPPFTPRKFQRVYARVPHSPPQHYRFFPHSRVHFGEVGAKVYRPSEQVFAYIFAGLAETWGVGDDVRISGFV